MKHQLAVGTRGSPLALAQARLVIDLLRAREPRLECEIKTIRTEGDEISARDLGLPLTGKALFTRRIEEALQRGAIDVAVHSLKDLPAASPPDLVLGAIPHREDPRDALVARASPSFEGLPPRATLGTSSLRRAAQLLAARPDLQIHELHGNVGTRLRRMEERGWDGIVVAAAGLKRLGLGDRITQTLPTRLLLPAPGQGALAVQARRGDVETLKLLGRIDDSPTRICVEAERVVSRSLGGDCNVPIGALAEIVGDALRLEACVVHPSGRHVVRRAQTGPRNDAEALGVSLAKELLAHGASKILEARTG